MDSLDRAYELIDRYINYASLTKMDIAIKKEVFDYAEKNGDSPVYKYVNLFEKYKDEITGRAGTKGCFIEQKSKHIVIRSKK